ncbi:YbhB/YbcL family Raf kinase inhibitor-like protein [Curvivirga sp.]|uniref:YbhB/YbcL family Raf kinase inhibitor-like protein n=1 Tax=Curvivirga sp. TaxID=2856848 RepID=UPI003B5C0647
MLRIVTILGAAVLSVNAFALDLKSADIEEGSRMDTSFEFNGFGCEGGNVSPALSWSNAPADTKSFAVTAYDPDAPTESGFWHWVVLDIPESENGLAKGASGNGISGQELMNDYGMVGYGGPCPPKGHGMHRYQFTVWALPVEKLEIPKGASNAVVGYFLNHMNLDKARLTATFVTE